MENLGTPLTDLNLLIIMRVVSYFDKLKSWYLLAVGLPPSLPWEILDPILSEYYL